MWWRTSKACGEGLVRCSVLDLSPVSQIQSWLSLSSSRVGLLWQVSRVLAVHLSPAQPWAIRCFRRTLVLEMLEGPWMLGWLWQQELVVSSQGQIWSLGLYHLYPSSVTFWRCEQEVEEETLDTHLPWARDVHLRTLCLNTSRQVYIAFQSGRLSSSPKSFRLFNSWTSKQYCVISEQYFLETSSWIFCSSHESCPVTKECFLV